jgi:hypothetical protein
MLPPWRHRICAQPTNISWVLGTLMLWIPATVTFHRWGVFSSAFTEFLPVLCVLLAYVCLCGFGFYAGILSLGWLVLRICRRVNGAPFEVGDQVAILTGPRMGTVARVYELTVGQGGQWLPRLDLGPEAATRYRDVFEDYTLLRLPQKGAQGASPM